VKVEQKILECTIDRENKNIQKGVRIKEVKRYMRCPRTRWFNQLIHEEERKQLA
jgi:hypothetical protein